MCACNDGGLVVHRTGNAVKGPYFNNKRVGHLPVKVAYR